MLEIGYITNQHIKVKRIEKSRKLKVQKKDKTYLMKQFSLLILFSLISNYTFAQGGAGYSQLSRSKSNVSSIMQSMGNHYSRSSYDSEEAKRAKEAKKRIKVVNFMKHRWDALQSFDNHEYANVISEYNKAVRLGFEDTDFEYIAGVSYYEFYKKFGEKKYKKRAKKLLKLSSRHGGIKAELYLDKLSKGSE